MLLSCLKGLHSLYLWFVARRVTAVPPSHPPKTPTTEHDAGPLRSKKPTTPRCRKSRATKLSDFAQGEARRDKARERTARAQRRPTETTTRQNERQPYKRRKKEKKRSPVEEEVGMADGTTNSLLSPPRPTTHVTTPPLPNPPRPPPPLNSSPFRPRLTAVSTGKRKKKYFGWATR